MNWVMFTESLLNLCDLGFYIFLLGLILLICIK